MSSGLFFMNDSLQPNHGLSIEREMGASRFRVVGPTNASSDAYHRTARVLQFANPHLRKYAKLVSRVRSGLIFMTHSSRTSNSKDDSPSRFHSLSNSGFDGFQTSTRLCVC